MNPKPNPIEVELISYPVNPLGTLFYVWEQSRTNDPIPSPAEIEWAMEKGSEQGKRYRETIEQIFDEDIPCTENITFVFAIRNMSISLREQMVRHRIGVTIGDRTGVDIVPELAKSTWWSQTTRMLPMGRFFQDGRYILPESLKDIECKDAVKEESWDSVDPRYPEWKDCNAEKLYLDLLEQIEFVYNKLVDSGVPMEDARQIIPVAVTHGITWTLNLKALMHIVGKRACWVAQANLWEDLISGMVNELCVKIDPIFRKIILPPCFKKGVYNSCPYFQINRERVQGRDNMPPCPLFVYHQTEEAIDAERKSYEETGNSATWYPVDGGDPKDIMTWNSLKPVEMQMLHDNLKRFDRLWQIEINPARSK